MTGDVGPAAGWSNAKSGRTAEVEDEMEDVFQFNNYSKLHQLTCEFGTTECA
jgi:hypothetical protein